MPTAAGFQLTLVIAGLFGPTRQAQGGSEDAAPSWPGFETFLARADRREQAAQGLEARVFDLFGLQAEEGADLPVAAVTRVLDLGVIDNGWWLRADPVNLIPDRDRLILSDNRALSLTQDEANRLAAEISESYAPDGWTLKTPRPGRWYLKPPRAPKLVTTPLPTVVGRDIHPYLPQGRDGKAWHTVLNEMQILLHTTRVNSERELAGKLPVNSLWFWGGGRLPKIHPVEWHQVWSLEPVSLALARLCECSAAAVPESLQAWQRQARPGRHLLIVDEARAFVAYGDDTGWQAVMARIERDWIAPALAALRARALDSVTLLDELGPSYVLTPRGTRRWWRRRRPLAGYAR